MAAPQHELNAAVFRAAVTLFERLQLEPSDGTTGEDVAHAVSRLFIRYANFLIKTWEFTRFDGNVGEILPVGFLRADREVLAEGRRHLGEVVLLQGKTYFL